MDKFTIQALFQDCPTSEKKYERIIELGKKLPSFPETSKTPENLVRGCQSQMFLDVRVENGKLFFSAWSDALISKGLASLLVDAYSGHTPEFVIKEKPLFLEELGILSSLTPSRSNGVQALYLKMQQLALQKMIEAQTEA